MNMSFFMRFFPVRSLSIAKLCSMPLRAGRRQGITNSVTVSMGESKTTPLLCSKLFNKRQSPPFEQVSLPGFVSIHFDTMSLSDVTEHRDNLPEPIPRFFVTHGSRGCHSRSLVR